MTKADLVLKMTIAAGGKLTRAKAALFVDGVFAELRQALIAENDISYRHFGRWELRRRGRRQGFDPNERKRIELEPSRTVVFHPAPALRARLGSRKV